MNSCPSRTVHIIGQPLTGAVFDILVELYQTILVQRGLIGDQLNALSRRAEYGLDAGNEARIQQMFDEAFRDRAEGFAQALIDARDTVGALTAAAFGQLRPDLTYPQVAEAFLQADREVSNGDLRDLIVESFAWRGILVPARRTRRLTGRIVRRSIVTRSSRQSV